MTNPPATWPAQLGAVLLFVLAYGIAYALLLRAARRRPGGAKIGASHVVPFVLGIAVIIVAGVPPLSRNADTLLSAHMLQHVLVADVATALIVLGLRAPLLTLGLPRRVLRTFSTGGPFGPVVRVITNPVFAVGLFSAVQWTWAVPPLLEAVRGNSALHLLQHGLLFWSGLLLWWVVIDPLGSRRHRPRMARLAIIGASRAALVMVCLPLTFLSTEFFPGYAESTRARGMDALADQQLAGASMCLIEATVFGIAFGLVLIDSLRREEAAQRASERAGEAALRRGGSTAPPLAGPSTPTR